MMIQDYAFYKALIELDFIKEVWLFGSRARGDNQERADLDLAISCPQATRADWDRVINIIENADTLLQIDCVRLEDLSKDAVLKQNILKEGIKIYDKQQD